MSTQLSITSDPPTDAILLKQWELLRANALGILSCLDLVKLEDILLTSDSMPCDVIHRFFPGLYIREVSIPAGTFVIGHEQLFSQANVFLKGKLRMYFRDGSTENLTAPMMFLGAPGKKVAYIFEDTVWQNIYPTAMSVSAVG